MLATKDGQGAKRKKTNRNNFQEHLKEWFFVLTATSLKNEYEKHAKTITRTEVKEKIREYF